MENQLSAPNRQIRLSGIQGALSSNATIRQITVADDNGVWLRIQNASIQWNRAALFRRRLSIDKLSAESIEMSRPPLPDKSLPSPEAAPFQVPELPVAVILRELDVPHLKFGQSVFGLASELAVTGNLELASGDLDTKLQIKRLDGPGGQLALEAGFSNSSRALKLDLALSEPANGVVANLLNMEGKPPVDLTIKGEGPLDNLDVTMNLDADNRQIVVGAVSLRQRDEGLAFRARLEGSIAELVAPKHREFFGNNGLVTASGVVRDSGGFVLDQLDVTSAQLTLSASAETTTDGFLRRLSVNGKLADPEGDAVVLPSGGGTSIQDGTIQLAFGEGGREDWNGRIELTGLSSGTISAETVRVILGGLAQNLNNPDARRVTFGIDGTVAGLASEKPELDTAIGDTIQLVIDGAWAAGQPIRLSQAELSGNGLSARLAGQIEEAAFQGTIALKAASLTPFSALANRDLAGALDMEAKGEVRPITGAFDLTLDGKADGLHLGIDAADNLFGGLTTITGGVGRGEAGIKADKLRLANDNMTLTADGTFSSEDADFGFDLALSDLALISDQASGRLTANGSAKGQENVIALAFDASVPSGTLSGRPLRDATLGFDGTLRDDNLDGAVTANAFLDGHKVSLTSNVAVTGGEKRLSGLSFVAGGTELTGNLTQTENGLFSGTLDLNAPDVSVAAALALLDASGSAQAHIELANANGEQSAVVDAKIRQLVVDAARVDSADVALRLDDLFGVPSADGTVSAKNVVAAGYTVTDLDATARREGARTNFTANAALSIGTTIATTGTLAPEGDGFRLVLTKADLAQGDLAAHLKRQTTIVIAGQSIDIDDLALAVGSGEITADGTIADTLNLKVAISALPLAIANTIKPDLGLRGTLTGTADVGGTRDAPNVRFDLNGRSLTAAELRQAGLSTLDLTARGSSTANRLTVEATLTSPEGFRATANGAVPLGDGSLDLTLALTRFPLEPLNALAPGQALAGAITGEAKVTGPLANPAANFTISGSGLSAAPLAEFGAAPLELRASGRFADQTLTLQSTDVGGPQGLSLSASGRLPLSGSGLDLQARGSVPLSLANRQLADRGTQVSGVLTFDAAVGGSFTQPVINGRFGTSGAQVIDPDTKVRLNDIVIDGTIDGDRITLRTVRAAVAGGGSLNAGGTISIDPRAGFPADLRLTLDQARYVDDELVIATVDGTLQMSGRLTRDPLVSGDLRIEKAEIMIPDSFGGTAPAIDVVQIDPPQAVVTTLKRAKLIGGTPVPASRPSIVQLDISISAPNQIFVRGRGLDAELGGRVRVTGPVTNVQPVGGFELIRGRIAIVGQRIVFDEGRVTLIGDLDPFINFSASTQGNGITVTISVRGRVSDPQITFSSQPELPQDEVLAQLIFKRSMSELSATQIAQLAAAAAELAGGGNSSLLQNLRRATGLDELDVITDSEGNAALQAGRYISDNIYLGVQAGAEGNTEATINLDITRDLKAKGAVASDGNSSLGLFFERDY
ncbi:translocation/assembly module TamB [Amorphus sp. 3PC139-8]